MAVDVTLEPLQPLAAPGAAPPAAPAAAAAALPPPRSGTPGALHFGSAAVGRIDGGGGVRPVVAQESVGGAVDAAVARGGDGTLRAPPSVPLVTPHVRPPDSRTNCTEARHTGPPESTQLAPEST